MIVFSGYYKQEEETSQTIDKNGWLHTGDIGFIDDEDNVFIVDRIKELIKYKGFQVSQFFLLFLLMCLMGMAHSIWARVLLASNDKLGQYGIQNVAFFCLFF